MLPKISLTITNHNDKDYPIIILRKFFNMVFIDPDGKKLNIYTATVFGGGEKSAEEKQAPSPHNVSNSSCSLIFKYSITDDGENNEANIEFKNLTDSFFSQRDWIKKVWGQVDEQEKQTEVISILKSKYPEIYPADTDINIPDMAQIKPVLVINDEQKGKDHFCMAYRGEYKVSEQDKNSYILSAHMSAGIEAMNWIRTTISLKTDILQPDNKINFEVVFTNGSEFFTPDFTWYFAPPTNYTVDVDSATLAIGANSSEKNRVSSVADDTTVEFEEWRERESIKDRKKARINFRDFLSDNKFLFSGKKICVCLSFINPERHGNTQFIFGLIVAFFLSFCSDKTRWDGYANCLKLVCMGESCCYSIFSVTNNCVCSNICNLIGIVSPILIILAFIAVAFSIKRCVPSSTRKLIKKMLIASRSAGVISTIALFLYVFVLWAVFPHWTAKIINTCLVNQCVLLALSAISLICNLVYTFYCGIVKKNRIIDFI